MKLEIYTDGASRGNPGLAAYAVQVYKGNKLSFSFGSCVNHATNSLMELSAFLLALRFIELNQSSNTKYEIFSDSDYVVKSYNEYIDNWIRTGRLMSRPNSELWKYISILKRNFSENNIEVTVTKVKGHFDNPKNNAVDAECNRLMDRRQVVEINLFEPLDLRTLSKVSTFSMVDDLPGNLKKPEFPGKLGITLKIKSIKKINEDSYLLIPDDPKLEGIVIDKESYLILKSELTD